jgi:hypothetical protein
LTFRIFTINVFNAFRIKKILENLIPRKHLRKCLQTPLAAQRKPEVFVLHILKYKFMALKGFDVSWH